VVGFVAYKINEPNFIDVPEMNEQRRRNSDEPLLIDAWKGFGQILPKSGDPEQNYGLKSEEYDIGQLQDKYFDASLVNGKLLEGYHLNPTINWKNAMFKGPSDEVRWPTFNMASDWYNQIPKPTPYTRAYPANVLK
jgi:hypothetical protein